MTEPEQSPQQPSPKKSQSKALVVATQFVGAVIGYAVADEQRAHWRSLIAQEVLAELPKRRGASLPAAVQKDLVRLRRAVS